MTVDKLEENYGMWRKIRGDGNCFYRAFGFAYLEHLIITKDRQTLLDFVFRYIAKCLIFRINTTVPGLKIITATKEEETRVRTVSDFLVLISELLKKEDR